MVCGHYLVTLPLIINQKLKWLSSLPILKHDAHLNARVILVVTV